MAVLGSRVEIMPLDNCAVVLGLFIRTFAVQLTAPTLDQTAVAGSPDCGL